MTSHATLKILFVCVLVFAHLGISAQNDTHIVQSGETLFRIALSYGLTTDELAQANNIIDTRRIFAGQTLYIPGVGATSTIVETTPLVTDSQQPIYHTIQRGETLRTIATLYGTTEDALIHQNGLVNPNRILAGDVLIIGGEVQAVEAAAVTTPTLSHTVQPGEYLSGIARRYGVSSQNIINMNSIPNPDRLLVGQQLIIPQVDGAVSSDATLYPQPETAVSSGRSIVVDLSNSRTYAYENGALVYEAVGSMGLPSTPTVQGNFVVERKVRSQTMSGPGYWLPNVEWVMYFYEGYALHGAYWHNNFGQPMSHGCVNLTNDDAQWFYNFADIGTPVTVQY